MAPSLHHKPRLVMKFGGTSLANPEKIGAAADKVAREAVQGHAVCVVVSAMGGVTDDLVRYCRAVDDRASGADYDTVLAAGEQVTAGLMALALQKRGLDARSWLGWQVPIACDDAHGRARIRDIPSTVFTGSFESGCIPVVAGFQGISPEGRITTLGRGGSDTTAVALAACIRAVRCDIYTDVDGLYTADPRIVPNARKINRASFEEVLELASQGAKVLHPRCVELAMRNDLPIQVLSSFGSDIGSAFPGTIIEKENKTMEQAVVGGIAHTMNEALVTLPEVEDRPGVIAAIIRPLAGAGIVIDTIVQSAASAGNTAITFSLPESDAVRAGRLLAESGWPDAVIDTDVAKVSAVGIGMRSQAGVAALFFEAMAGAGINIRVVSTSDIKISVLIARRDVEKAISLLHTAYGLDKPGKVG